MSELVRAPAEPLNVVEDPEHVIEAVGQPPVVIPEQEVAFSTAAAVPLPGTKPARRMIAALCTTFLNSPADTRPAQRHYPPRRDRFSRAGRHAREMHRL
jgi:hypothetical protein